MSELAWHTSSFSAPDNANCVEVAESWDEVKVRDTQNRAAGHLVVPVSEWSAFLADVKGDHL
ncbi:DUF397 domain-containing protein [Streptomonospora litoralis]|uniref:DUF397 domain-containing protein n=1 Tax=Streptomonospora litoralis TaxID=2498135 RepID=A0A4P6QB82_9ACTN|nr:DUF397 domain-containing protein [Streptomonospora litoralis]QBI56647.1 hypothetical protein EKD16_24515 [Streptomonospora litoralis]